MSYWSDETERIECLARKALAAKDLSQAKYLLRLRNRHSVPTKIEWISDGLMPLGMMFRQMVLDKDDEGLKDEFWMTLKEARHMLNCVDLATLPAWDAGALLDALTLSPGSDVDGPTVNTAVGRGILRGAAEPWRTPSGMTKQQIERRISLAQASGQLGLTFLAKDGLAWAQRMGINWPDSVLAEAIEKLSGHFDGSFEERWQAWCAAQESQALRPPRTASEHEKAETNPGAEEPRAPRLREQEVAIIGWLEGNSYEPQNLPFTPNGLRTAKAEARAALDGKGVFAARTAFNKAWDRLREGKEIKGGTEEE
jgi:hypothetical protein